MAIGVSDLPWLATKPATAVKTMRVRVVMAFLLKTERQEIGSELTLPLPLAHELIGYRKVEKIGEADAELPPQSTAPAATRRRRTSKE